MRNKKFWYDALERAASTAAQGLIALIGMDQFNVLDLNYPALFGTAAGMALLSILKSIAASNVGTKGNASLVQ